MTAEIDIHCETAGQLINHLNEIINTIKIKATQNMDYEFNTGAHFKVDSIMGTHDVYIISEASK